MRGILYKGTLPRNPRCNRRLRIDEADISTPEAVDQRVTNCQEESVCGDILNNRNMPAKFETTNGPRNSIPVQGMMNATKYLEMLRCRFIPFVKILFRSI
ncbi:hypothetical protein TNCV_4648941 [Trichonephila clavipes]|uniref:Uncharacterized protein n=1 Tax=Trichonephila clavipes TaxID=2585209 RepID=A0A8X6T240_TRICX|nr:hypothetical protein TNCV_4648941 [Trichonephila clavipes]